MNPVETWEIHTKKGNRTKEKGCFHLHESKAVFVDTYGKYQVQL